MDIDTLEQKKKAEAQARADAARAEALTAQAAAGYTGAAPTAPGSTFDQAKYDELKKYNAAAAEAYKASTMPKPAAPEAPAPVAGEPGYYSPQAGRLLESAKTDIPGTAATALDMVAGPRSLLTSGPDPAPDPSIMYGGIKEIEKAPDPSEVYGGMVEPYTTPEKAKATAKAAADVVTAAPNRVEAVIEKLKAEEKKGGPGIWDVIEAAAAGWHGKVPLYVQKQLEAAAEEARTEQIKTTASLQAALEAEQQAEAFKRQQQLLSEELASRERIALGQQGTTLPGLSGLSSGFMGLGTIGGK